MRIRSLKPDFFVDEDLAAMDPLDRITFEGLWCAADKAGRLEDRPSRLAVQILPYEAKGFEDRLSRLAAARFIIRYQDETGRPLIAIRTWDKHQRPHHTEAESTLAPPPADQPPPPLPPPEGKGKEGRGLEASPPRPNGGITVKTPLENVKVPESLAAVTAYWREAGLTGSPESFFDHFASNGWRVGGKAPMKDWRAAARNWARNEKKFGGGNGRDKGAAPVSDRLTMEEWGKDRPDAKKP